MKTSVSVFDRIVLFIFSALLLLVATWAIASYFDVAPAQWLHDTGRMEAWEKIPEQSWYVPVLGVITAILAVVGCSLVVANLRSHRFSTVAAAESQEKLGEISLPVADVADAVCADLERNAHINQADSRVYRDNGIPTLEVTVAMPPQASLPAVVAALKNAERDLRDALGHADIASTYKIELDR